MMTLFTSALALATMSTAPIELESKMITLPNPDPGGAACLDGSPYAFYIVPGSSASFSIGIEGGGWCYDEIDCLERSKTTLGTSTLWNATSPPPAFNCYGMDHNCTMVYLPYCDGSSFTGDREQPWPVPNTSTPQHVLFRGRRNLARTLDILARDWGLGSAADVVLYGGSAGGLSTFLGLDYVQRRLPSARVAGMPVAGYFLDHAPAPFAGPIRPNPPPFEHVPKPYSSYPQAIRYMVGMHNSTDHLDPECRASFGPADSWQCAMAPHAQSFVKAPFFAVQSRFDEFQLGPGIARVPCLLGQNYAPPYKTDAAHVCNATERQYIGQYGADFMQQFAPVLQSERNGCFLVSCIQHGINAAIDNVTSSEAFAAWHTKAALGKEHGYHFVDDCGQGGATPCNTGAGCAPPHIEL